MEFIAETGINLERYGEIRAFDEVVVGGNILIQNVQFALRPFRIHHGKLICFAARGRCLRFNIIKNSSRTALPALIVLVVDVPILV